MVSKFVKQDVGWVFKRKLSALRIPSHEGKELLVLASGTVVPLLAGAARGALTLKLRT